MPVRRRLRRGSSSTPASATSWARSTRARPRWTGWSRSRSAASRSPRPPRPAPGREPGSTSSTRRDTSTSPPRSSAPCASSTARSPCSTPCPASSPSPRRSGARPTSYGVPRIAFVNKMDRVGADFDRCVEMMVSKLGARPVPIILPWGSAETFRGVIDLFDEKAYDFKDEALGAEFQTVDVPAEHRAELAAWREKAIEAIAETDDDLMHKYLEGVVPSTAELKAALRRATIIGQAPPGRLRLRLQEQGGPAAPRRRHRVPPLAASTSRRSRASTRTARTPGARRRTTRRSRASSSRS